MRKIWFVFLILILLATATTVRPARAQASEPVYIIQSGDTLYSIAARFNVSLDDLIAANPDVNPNDLAIGQEIVIPNLEGITGVLQTEVVEFGDSLRSLRRRTQVSDENLRRLNHLISPSELYVGVSLILPVQEGQRTYNAPIAPTSGESLFELAIKEGSDQWTLSALNKLEGTWSALPGDVLYSPAEEDADSATGLPSAFVSASISPLPMAQGSTEVIRIKTRDNISASATLIDKPLNFFPLDDEQVALQGIHALLDPGVYPFRIEATLPSGETQSFEQMVVVVSGAYLSEDIPLNDPSTLDPAVTEPELKNLEALTQPATPIKHWDSVFISPAVDPNCATSRFGTRRTYTVVNSEIEIEGFHSGLDFCGGEGLPITAPAPGRVVFAAPLTVRGNATIIDHGWGVYSGFWHQSEIQVNVGDLVEQGQVIGLVGGTGRVTGAHLHWEVWVNGIQVNPLNWLEQAYP
ncbi:MAG: peptidoglycan DD-metalloendopeptidase family protein [Anaerolineales bacterium]|nr:peptidoglycan DD-metalloendopeptidase family protein [Anaerolineales bacterium]